MRETELESSLPKECFAGQVFASYWLSLRSLMKQKCSFVQQHGCN